MKYTDRIEGVIKPVDVKIYLEDGMPYLDYTGTVTTKFGKLKVHIPKMSLEFNEIICEREEYSEFYYPFDHPILIQTKQEFFACNDKAYELEIIEREMSKAQIEKELGYKIKICE